MLRHQCLETIEQLNAAALGAIAARASGLALVGADKKDVVKASHRLQSLAHLQVPKQRLAKIAAYSKAWMGGGCLAYMTCELIYRFISICERTSFVRYFRKFTFTGASMHILRLSTAVLLATAAVGCGKSDTSSATSSTATNSTAAAVNVGAADSASQSAVQAANDAGDAAVASDASAGSTSATFAFPQLGLLLKSGERQFGKAADVAVEVNASFHKNPNATKGAVNPIDPNTFVDDHGGQAKQLACLLRSVTTVVDPNIMTSAASSAVLQANNANTASINTSLPADIDVAFTMKMDDTSACKQGGRTRTGEDKISHQKGEDGYSVDCNSVVQLSTGDHVAISSADPNQPTLSFEVAGSRASGAVELSVKLNARHQHKGADGNVTSDYKITSDAADGLKVVHTYATQASSADAKRTPISREIEGTIHVRSDAQAFTATVVFADVKRDMTSDCGCPSSGKITQTVVFDDATTFTRTYTFTACGAGTVAVSGSTTSAVADGSADFAWAACAPS